jgi:hypothetical protein
MTAIEIATSKYTISNYIKEINIKDLNFIFKMSYKEVHDLFYVVSIDKLFICDHIFNCEEIVHTIEYNYEEYINIYPEDKNIQITGKVMKCSNISEIGEGFSVKLKCSKILTTIYKYITKKKYINMIIKLNNINNFIIELKKSHKDNCQKILNNINYYEYISETFNIKKYLYDEILFDGVTKILNNKVNYNEIFICDNDFNIYYGDFEEYLLLEQEKIVKEYF